MEEINNQFALPKEILDALVLYLKDEVIQFYLSEEGRNFYQHYLKEITVKDVNDIHDSLEN